MNFSPSFALKGAGALAVATLLGCGPSDGSAEFEDGKAAYEVRDLKKADKLLEESVKKDETDVDRLISLARVKLDLGELEAARELVEQAGKSAGSDSDVLLLGAQVAWHQKDYEKAAQDFSKVADDSALEASVRSQALAGRGIVEMSRNEPHLARIDFLSAIRADRRNAAAWYHLGLLYRDGFDYAEAALEQFEIYVRLEESASPRVQKTQRTIIPALKEHIAQTAADRPGASKRNSAASASQIAKAEAAAKKGNLKAARTCYQAALAADALSYPAALGLAKVLQRTDASKAGQAKALENYKLACALRPSSVSTFLTTGALAARLGYHAQAVAAYSRAVAASPTSLEAIDGLIRSLRKVGNKTRAANAYQRYRDMLAKRKK